MNMLSDSVVIELFDRSPVGLGAIDNLAVFEENELDSSVKKWLAGSDEFLLFVATDDTQAVYPARDWEELVARCLPQVVQVEIPRLPPAALAGGILGKAGIDTKLGRANQARWDALLLMPDNPCRKLAQYPVATIPEKVRDAFLALLGGVGRLPLYLLDRSEASRDTVRALCAETPPALVEVVEEWLAGRDEFILIMHLHEGVYSMTAPDWLTLEAVVFPDFVETHLLPQQMEHGGADYSFQLALSPVHAACFEKLQMTIHARGVEVQ